MDDPRGQLTWSLEPVPVGEDAVDPAPGDFILCHRKGLVSAIIRFGERLRPGGDPRWSHAALIETPGTVIEALTRGTVRSELAEYRQTEYAIVRTHLSPEDAAQAVAFARSCIGERYGWLTILGIAMRYLTPGRGLWFGLNGTEICSGEVAQCQCRGWANFAQNPASITPSELARHAGAPAPSPKEKTLPTITQLRRYLTLTVLPVLVGAVSNWIVVHVHFLAAFHVSQSSVAGELTQLGVFGITAGLAFLASHHILKGTYRPAPTSQLLGEATIELKPVLGTAVASPPAPVTVNVHPAPAPPQPPADTTPAAPAVPTVT